MASTLESRLFNNIRDTPLSNLDGPSPTRIAPIKFSYGQDSWDRRSNIWKMSPGALDPMSNGQNKNVSPIRNNRMVGPDTSKVIARASTGGNQNTNTSTSNDLQALPTSTFQFTKPIGPLTSPTRLRSNGVLGTNSQERMISDFSQSSRSTDSAPDFEYPRYPFASSAFARSSGSTIGQNFRHFNVEDAEEFVPSYLQDHTRQANPFNSLNRKDMIPVQDMMAATKISDYDHDHVTSSAQQLSLSNRDYFPSGTRVGVNSIPAYDEIVDHNRHSSMTTSSRGNLLPFSAHQPQLWTSGPTSVFGNANGMGMDANSSSLRPEVAAYQPSSYVDNFNNHRPQYKNSAQMYNNAALSQRSVIDTQSHSRDSQLVISNTHALGHNANNGAASARGHYDNPHALQASRSGTQSDEVDARYQRTVGKAVYPGSGITPMPATRPNTVNNTGGHTGYGAQVTTSYYQTPYDFGTDQVRATQFRTPYSIDPVSVMTNFVQDSTYSTEPDSKDPSRSKLLEEFRVCHKTREYQLKDITGYIVEFSGDQAGSRFIQTKLEKATSEEKDQIFSELQINARQLMSDVFGNYVIQKMFDYGNQSQKKTLAGYMQGYVFKLSLQPYGCRCVQKAFEHILTDQQVTLINELEGNVMTVVESQHGNHVIQKAIECIPGEHIQFVIDAHKNQVVRLSKHIYGCRIIQRMLEHCKAHVKRSILDELQHAIPSLIDDQYGNYVIQCIIKRCDGADRYRVLEHVKRDVFYYSRHKFASNVVEKALQFADEEQRTDMVERLTRSNLGGGAESPVSILLRDQFGNYVMQTVLKTIQGPLRRALADEVRYHLTVMGKVNRGKQISAMADMVSAIYAGHSPSSVSTGIQTPRTPASVNSAGMIGTPTIKSVDEIPSGFSISDAQRNTLSMRSLHA